MINYYARHVKRPLDIILGGIGLVIFAVPLGIIACVVRWKLGSPVFFLQERVGYHGGPFTILKFRTMTGDEKVPSAFFRWLRAAAMDELPQLINILRGEMSFVGPRPVIPEELRELEGIPRGRERFLIRPGLTGLAQTRGDKAPSLPERLRWDLQYLDQSSLALDLRILLRSVVITLLGAWEHPRAKNRPGES